MTRHTYRSRSDEGAVLVHVAVVLIGLLALSVFVVDYGVMWASRRQAQNAADAAALAGAGTLAFDDPTLGSGGNAYAAAEQLVTTHRVWGEIAGYRILVGNTNATPDDPCPMWEADGVTCVRVDVHRDGTLGSTQLPMLFGHFLGLTQQRMRATATARVSGANSVRCVLPLALADRWADNYDASIDTSVFLQDGATGITGWSQNDSFERPQGDVYIAPYLDSTTGWSTTRDFGRQLVMHEPVGTYSAGWAAGVDLNGGTGADIYRQNLWDCVFNNISVGIAAADEDCSEYMGEHTTTEMAQAGCLGIKTGVMSGPGEQGVMGGGPVPLGMGIVEQDPGAVWSSSANSGRGAVVDGSGRMNMGSARIRPVAVMDINHYMDQEVNCSGGSGCTVKVSNIIGFFIEGMCDELKSAGRLAAGSDCVGAPNDWKKQVVGRIVTLPGWFATGNGAPVTESSFVKLVQLIR